MQICFIFGNRQPTCVVFLQCTVQASFGCACGTGSIWKAKRHSLSHCAKDTSHSPPAITHTSHGHSLQLPQDQLSSTLHGHEAITSSKNNNKKIYSLVIIILWTDAFVQLDLILQDAECPKSLMTTCEFNAQRLCVSIHPSTIQQETCHVPIWKNLPYPNKALYTYN